MSEGKTIITNHTFFLEILKAVYLSTDWVPKLIQKTFPTMEQKLFQRCETEIVAVACNASYKHSFVPAVRMYNLCFNITEKGQMIVRDKFNRILNYTRKFGKFFSSSC